MLRPVSRRAQCSVGAHASADVRNLQGHGHNGARASSLVVCEDKRAVAHDGGTRGR